MKPSISAIVAAGVTGLLLAVAWLILFPVYDTNDDVAIRLFLEGRAVPDGQPSGYVYFMNLALAQVIAWLYRSVPGVSWYDILEQGTLALTTSTALYCCLRSVRFGDHAVFVVLIAATMLPVMAAVQFTVVGVLSTIVGATALIVALTRTQTRSESVALSGAGAVLLAIGTLIRLEAALLGILVVVLAGLHLAVTTLRRDGIRGKRWVLSLALLAFAASALAWSYHFAAYFGSAEWKEFYLFNFLRGRLTEYAAARMPPEVLNQAFAAAGWTVADYEMLNQFLFFDTNLFSTEKLSAVLANLPVLSDHDPLAVVGLLLSYGTRFPFFLFGAAGVVLTASRAKTGLSAMLSFVAVFIVVVAISVFLKPLEYRVFWPTATGTMFVMWIAIHARREAPPHWGQRAMAAAMLIVACVLALVPTVDRSKAGQRMSAAALADLARAPIGPANSLVIIGSSFPFEFVERPFGAPWLQRSIRALPVGTTLRAPPVAHFLDRNARPDTAAWLCSDLVFVMASDAALNALLAYYLQHRGETISFTTVFKGSTFVIYRCSISK